MPKIMPKLYNRTLAEQIRWGRSNHQLWSSSTSAIETCSHKDLVCHLWWGSRKKKRWVFLQEHGHFGELQGSESAGTRSKFVPTEISSLEELNGEETAYRRSEWHLGQPVWRRGCSRRWLIKAKEGLSDFCWQWEGEAEQELQTQNNS